MIQVKIGIILIIVSVVLLFFFFPFQALSQENEIGCFQQYPELETLTAPNWFTNIESEKDQRYEWWRSRKKFQPILGENTVIAGVVYTLSKSILKMTVLFPPLYPEENRLVSFYMRSVGTDNEEMLETSQCQIKEYTWHCTLRVDKLDETKRYIFRVHYQPSPSIYFTYDGVIPAHLPYPRFAALGCFGRDSVLNKHELVEAVLSESPDVIALQGDQIYGTDNLAYGFLELIYSINMITRQIPTLVQMDDHDYGLGNLWGAGYSTEDSGSGFKKPACVINALEDMAMYHLPDPASKTTLLNGIGMRFTNYLYGNVDFAILEARKFKNDYPGKSLLGSNQEEWLKSWCSNNDKRVLKIVLAQTPFAMLSTNVTGYKMKKIVEGKKNTDPNAYPPEGRNRFMQIVKDCSPLVISGDQHLGIAVTYEEYGISECASPAAINDVYWRINLNPIGASYLDPYGHQYTLHNVWNVDKSLWGRLPLDTRDSDNQEKSRRAEGFLMVGLDGENAVCEMHSYRVNPELVWKVEVPAGSMS